MPEQNKTEIAEQIKIENNEKTIELEKLNLHITYRNMFKFMNTYAHAKDLIGLTMNKKEIGHEAIFQLIYVGYLGSNAEPKVTYEEFMDIVPFDFSRDSILFKNLITNYRKHEKN